MRRLVDCEAKGGTSAAFRFLLLASGDWEEEGPNEGSFACFLVNIGAMGLCVSFGFGWAAGLSARWDNGTEGPASEQLLSRWELMMSSGTCLEQMGLQGDDGLMVRTA